MPRIYISHRPEDSSRNEVTIIRDRLIAEFGEDNILQSTGSNMEVTTNLQRLVQSCDVLLVVIGQYWTNMVDEKGNLLLEDPYDPIHVEVDAGLKTMMVIKTLVVDGSRVPSIDSLPDALKNLMLKDVIEAQDDMLLGRVLDELMSELEIIPTGSMAEENGIDIDNLGIQTTSQQQMQAMHKSPSTQDIRLPEAPPLPQLNNINPNILPNIIGLCAILIMVAISSAMLNSPEEIPITENNIISEATVHQLDTRDSLENEFSFYKLSDTSADFIYVPAQTKQRCIYNTRRYVLIECKSFKADIEFDNETVWDGRHNAWITLDESNNEVIINSNFWGFNSYKLERHTPLSVVAHNVNDYHHAIVATDTGQLVWMDYIPNRNIDSKLFVQPDSLLDQVQLELDPNQQTLLVQFDNELQLWNVIEREKIQSITFENNIQYVAFVSLFEELQILTVTDDGMIYYLSPTRLDIMQQTAFLKTLAYPEQQMDVADVSATGLIAVSSSPSILQFWDLYAEELIYVKSFSGLTKEAQFNHVGTSLVLVESQYAQFYGVDSE